MSVGHVVPHAACGIGECEVAGGRPDEHAEDEEMAATTAEET